MRARLGRPSRWLRLIAAASVRKRVLMRSEAVEGAGAVVFEGARHTFDSHPPQSRHMIDGTVRSGGFFPQGAFRAEGWQWLGMQALRRWPS